MLFDQYYAQINENDGDITRITFKIASASQNLPPAVFLFSDLKKMLAVTLNESQA